MYFILESKCSNHTKPKKPKCFASTDYLWNIYMCVYTPRERIRKYFNNLKFEEHLIFSFSICWE